MSELRPEMPPMLRFTREEFSGDDNAYAKHIERVEEHNQKYMSEQRRAIAKLEFPIKEGGRMAPPPSPRPKGKDFINTQLILAEYDQHLLDDWDRRLKGSNRINSLLEDLDKDSL
jgi:hypothetical protein